MKRRRYLVFETLGGGYVYAFEAAYPFGEYSPFRGLRPIYAIRVRLKRELT
jgi:hypothetical protein